MLSRVTNTRGVETVHDKHNRQSILYYYSSHVTHPTCFRSELRGIFWEGLCFRWRYYIWTNLDHEWKQCCFVGIRCSLSNRMWNPLPTEFDLRRLAVWRPRKHHRLYSFLQLSLKIRLVVVKCPIRYLPGRFISLWLMSYIAASYRFLRVIRSEKYVAQLRDMRFPIVMFVYGYITGTSGLILFNLRYIKSASIGWWRSIHELHICSITSGESVKHVGKTKP